MRGRIKDEEINMAVLNCEVSHDLYRKLTFLYRHNFLNAEYPDLNQYSAANLTPLGVACTEINECDPQILAKCICAGVFDRFSEEELIGALAVFLGEEKSRELRYSDMASMLRPIFEMETLVNEQRRAGRMEECPPLSDYWVNPVRAWLKDGSIGAVYNEEGLAEELSEGEFVKAILKVANICEEVYAVATLLQLETLAKKLENFKARLIWGIVTPQSLYV
jgi:superfamily II RNA helicase